MFVLRRLKPADLVLGLLFVIVVLTGAFCYMSRERMIYSWDEANYTGLTDETYSAFFSRGGTGTAFHPVYGLRTIHSSFGREYNLLFTLPLAFWERLFGTIRTVFVLGTVLIYFVPFALFWALVARRVFALPGRTAFWGTVGTILAVPPTYLSVLRGFPDVGAAALLGLAALLYLRDIRLRNGWQRLALGLILCLAPLFRRHFLYGVSAFLFAVILQHLIILAGKIKAEPRQTLREAGQIAWRLTAIGLVALAVWLVFALPFVKVLLSNNYFHLYGSFMLPSGKVLSGFTSAYGYFTALAALVGYVVGWRYGVLRGAGAVFVSLLGALSVLQWVLIVRQQGTHYLNHFNIFIVFGLLALVASAVKALRGLPRVLVLATIAAALVYRTLFCLGGVPALDSPDPDGVVLARQPPQVRADYEEVRRLIGDLRQQGGNGAPIYVAACSWMMNFDVLRNGEGDMWGKENARLCVVQTPHVDSRDWLPVDMLLKSDYVLTVSPTQFSLAPQDEKVVSLVVEAFENHLPVAQDFERLPGVYHLNGGATATLYRRTRPATRSTALAELAREEAIFAAGLPGRQKDWVSLDSDPRWELTGDKAPYTLTFREQGYRLPSMSPDAGRRRLLAFVRTVPQARRIEGTVKLSGRWKSDAVVVRAGWADTTTGDYRGGVVRVQATDGAALSLTVPDPPANENVRLLLEVQLPRDADPAKQETPDGQFVLERFTL